MAAGKWSLSLAVPNKIMSGKLRATNAKGTKTDIIATAAAEGRVNTRSFTLSPTYDVQAYELGV